MSGLILSGPTEVPSPKAKKQRLGDGFTTAPPEHGGELEYRLFKLWAKASLCEARAALQRDNRAARDEYRRLEDKYLKETDRLLEEHGLFYDPNRRAFVEYLKGIDVPTSKLWFQFRPVAEVAEASGSSTTSRRKLRHRYDFRILSPETKRNRSTVETLERYQIRRYLGVFPGKVGFLAPESAVLKGMEGHEGAGAQTVVDAVELWVYRWPDGTPQGAGCNEAAERAVKDGCEVLVICTGREMDVCGDVDLFYPAYPVLLPSALLLTPVQLLQINGADPTPAADLRQGLVERVGGLLGAVLQPRDAHNLVPRLAPFDAKAWAHVGGLSSTRDGIERDARVSRVRPGLATHIPKCTHGWLSTDTQILLATALEAFRPAVILELGSWYGLSSRFILQRAVSGAALYAVDWFKNVAHYGRRMDGISPLDKLYQKHLRYETFCANIEPLLRGGDKACFTVRMDIHAAVGLFAQHQVPVEMVFVDAEKNTGRLVNLLRRIMASFPRAVIVGDDHVFDSVKRAIAELALGDRVVTRDEAYLILPQVEERPTALEAMGRLEVQLALLPTHAELCELIKQKEYSRAVQVAEHGGLGITADLYSQGKTVLHEICRQKDAGALQVLESFCETADGIPVNELGLTPFDYFTHKIDFS